MRPRTLVACLSILSPLVSGHALAQTTAPSSEAPPPDTTTPPAAPPGATPGPPSDASAPKAAAPPATTPEEVAPAPAEVPAAPSPSVPVAVAPQPASVTRPVIVNEALDDETRGQITETHDGDPDAGTEEEGHAGYVPGTGFHIQTADGNYLMRIEMRAALKFEPAWTDGEKDARGSLAFVRPALRGNFIKPWVRYAFAMELARGDAFLLTANVEVQPWNEFGFRYGQQGTPVSRHLDFAPHNIFFPDYASVATFFWSGRQRGLTLFGTIGESLLNYWAGIFGGSPIQETENNPNNYIAEGRLAVNPWGRTNANELPFTPERESLPTRASFAIEGYHGKLQTSADNYNPSNSVLNPLPILISRTMTTGGADVWFQSGPVIATTEYYYRHIEANDGLPGYDSQGIWGQVMVDVYKQLIGVGARFNWLNPNMDVSHDRVLEGEGQVAWFIKPRQFVLKLRYALLDQKEPDPAALGPGYQLPFIPGTTNVVTLQLTMEL